jgi:hypothetical protein
MAVGVGAHECKVMATTYTPAAHLKKNPEALEND